MASKSSSQSNKFVGVRRADGTVYKLMTENDLRNLILDHTHGWMDINAICKKYKISKTQFHRQMEYRDRVLENLMKKMERLMNIGCTSDIISWLLNIPLETTNKIIITINEKNLKQQSTNFGIYD